MNLGTPELLLVLAVVMLLFGGTKLPSLARSLGEAKREFETARDDTPATASPSSTSPSSTSPSSTSSD
jgi:sec-independent protein translocase protein TatA